MTMTKEEAVHELALDDHGIVTEELARQICAPFGFTPAVALMTDTRDQFKGAMLPGCSRAGQQAQAIGVLELAYQIAAHLHLDTSRADRMLGRGSAAREVVQLLRQHVEARP
jgi:hypothetical protein